MDLNLKGKSALVTGGATGIGQAIAVDLAKEGVAVAITSRDAGSIEKTLSKIGGTEAGHYGICSNITEEGEPERIASEIIDKFGNPDILVNNVGSTLKILDPYCPISDWRALFRLNVEVHVEMSNALIPHMRDQGWGRIVNISSCAGMENSGPVPFCATKAALTAYSRSMGRVLAPDNIVMSAVFPGVVLTERGDWAENQICRPEHAEKYLNERTPLKRFGDIYEVSPMVVFLCSDLASFCQGSIVPVDGGQSRHYYAR